MITTEHPRFLSTADLCTDAVPEFDTPMLLNNLVEDNVFIMLETCRKMKARPFESWAGLHSLFRAELRDHSSRHLHVGRLARRQRELRDERRISGPLFRDMLSHPRPHLAAASLVPREHVA